MAVELELKQRLEGNGFYPKETKIGAIWTYDHKKYMTINYGNDGYIWFNLLSKYMRDKVKSANKNIAGLSPDQKKELYKNTLVHLESFQEIKYNLRFSLRKTGSDWIGISEKVGIEVLNSVLEDVIKIGNSLKEESPSVKGGKV